MDGLLKNDTKLEDWFKSPTFVGFFVYSLRLVYLVVKRAEMD